VGVMRCPIGDFPLGAEERAALQRVIDSGRISEGNEVRAFEDEFAAYMGTRHCVAVSSGTAALMVGLKALVVTGRVSSSAKVLIPALTFIATANAVSLSSLRLAFGDIQPGTMGLDPSEVSKRTPDIVLPVHLMGYGADVIGIQQQCEARQAVLVEDAAEAHGTMIAGGKAGTFGLWGAFSFYIAHTVQAGELGCIVTDDVAIAEAARQLKAHGRQCTCRRCTRSTTGCPYLGRGDGDPRFQAEYVGWNFKPMEFQAALGRVQLSHIKENIARRKAIRAGLHAYLKGLEDDGYIESLPVQFDAVPMAYPVVLKHSGYRNQVVAELERRGVEARPLFGCIPTQQPAYVGQFGDAYCGQLPVAEHYGADGFYVGCHQYLSVEQVEYMILVIREVITEVIGKVR